MKKKVTDWDDEVDLLAWGAGLDLAGQKDRPASRKAGMKPAKYVEIQARSTDRTWWARTGKPYYALDDGSPYYPENRPDPTVKLGSFLRSTKKRG